MSKPIPNYIEVRKCAYIELAKIKSEGARDILCEALEAAAPGTTIGEHDHCTFDALHDEVTKMPDWATDEACAFMRGILEDLTECGAGEGDIFWY